MTPAPETPPPPPLPGRGIRSIVTGAPDRPRSNVAIREAEPEPVTEERRLAWPLDPYAGAGAAFGTVFPKVLVFRRAGRVDPSLSLTDPDNWVPVTRGFTAGSFLAIAVSAFDPEEMAGTVTTAHLTGDTLFDPVELGIEYAGDGTEPRIYENSRFTALKPSGMYPFELYQPDGQGGYFSLTAPPFSVKERFLSDPARWDYEGSNPVNTTAPNLWPDYPEPQPFRIRLVLNDNFGSLAIIPPPDIAFGALNMLNIDMPVRFMGGSLA
jgi:hypothetical protein